MLGLTQSYTILYNGLDQSILIWADECMGRERQGVAEGANRETMNLSGKKTHTGRISGECCMSATNEESHYGKLSGSRTEISL